MRLDQVDAGLRDKFMKAAQHILKNQTLLICSGSGMTVECTSTAHQILESEPGSDKHLFITNGFKDIQSKRETTPFTGPYIPLFRGTHGLWLNYPQIKKLRITFEQMQESSFFHSFPQLYWYVYGHLFNRLKFAEPHVGYQSLHGIIRSTGQLQSTLRPQLDDNYFIYHQGIDPLYQKARFDKSRICQPKGSLFRWRCNNRNCDHVLEREQLQELVMEIDYITGDAKVPQCGKCGSDVRPNIQLRNDLSFHEAQYKQEMELFEEFMERNKRRSCTILEIGAGPAQPLARELGRLKFKQMKKYNCALISINPVPERKEQYSWEKEQFEKISSHNMRKQQLLAQITQYKEEIKNFEERQNMPGQDENRFDGIIARKDTTDVEGHPTIESSTDELIMIQRDIDSKRHYVKSMEKQIESMFDDIELHNGQIPNYYLQTNEERIREEQDQLATSKNPYIEIQMGAKDALLLLREAVDLQLK